MFLNGPGWACRDSAATKMLKIHCLLKGSAQNGSNTLVFECTQSGLCGQEGPGQRKRRKRLVFEGPTVGWGGLSKNVQPSPDFYGLGGTFEV